MNEINIIEEMRPDSTKRTPPMDIDHLLNIWYSEKTALSKKVIAGIQFVNLVNARLRKECMDKKEEKFELPSGLQILFEDIKDLNSRRGELSVDGQKAQDFEICGNLSLIIDNFLYGELLRFGIISHEWAKETISGEAKSEKVGERIPIKVTKEEEEEYRKRRSEESRSGEAE